MATIVRLGSSQHALLKNPESVKFDPVMDFRTIVMQGMFPGRKFIRINGLNTDISAGVPENIWPLGGDYEFLPSPDFIDIVSDSVDDTLTGIGAREIRVFALDAEANEVQETLVLNGTTPVTTSFPVLHIQRLRVTTAGSTTVNVGTITATGSSSTLVIDSVPPGFNGTLNAQVMVPNNQAYYLEGVVFSLAKKKDAEALITIAVREFQKVFAVSTLFSINSSGDGLAYNFQTPAAFPPKSQIKVRAEVSANNVQATSYMEYLAAEITQSDPDPDREIGHQWTLAGEFVGDG